MVDSIWLVGSFSRWPPKALPTSIRADTCGVRHLMLNALGMRFGEPVNKDALSMKTVARRAPSSYTGAFTNQDVSIT